MKIFFSSFEIAKICQVSPSSVTRWIHEGKLPASTTAGGHHRVLAENLLKFLKSLKMPIPPELGEAEKKSASLKALVIDDEFGVREMIRWMFQRHFPDIEIQEADEGFAAGWKACALKPRLVILDLMLPGLDGYKVCQFIRSFEELKETKILAMTGLQTADVRTKMLQFGADDFIAKPFDVGVLRQKIDALLGLAKNTEAARAAASMK